MAILQWGIGLFLAAFLVHLLVWRIRKPGSSIRVLLAIFLGVAVLGLIALYLTQDAARSRGLPVLSNLAAYLHVLSFVISIAFAYIVVYTGLEWDSPTLSIVTMIARAGKTGVDEAELVQRAEKLPFLESRMQDLIRSGILVERDVRFVLSARPHYFFRSILLYNRLLRKEQASG
jgi:hypothetical protein